MKIGQKVYVVRGWRVPSGGYTWLVEQWQVVSSDRETVCLCCDVSRRLAFHPAAHVYENAGIADSVRADYTRRQLTPREVFGE